MKRSGRSSAKASESGALVVYWGLPPERAICKGCGGHQDSAHIDKNVGPGEMDVLRGVKQTDQTRDITNNH